jgi:hypothetical protein
VFRLVLAMFALFTSLVLDTDPPEGDPPPEPPPEDPPVGDPQQPYFVAQTKDEFEARYGPTRNEGRQVREKEILEKHGFNSQEEMDAWIETYKTVERETESAVEKAEREAQEAKDANERLARERDQERDRRHEVLKRAALERALVGKGVRADRIEDATDFALRRQEIAEKLSLDDSEKVAGHEEAADAVKERYAEWFSGTQTEPVTATRGGSRGPVGEKREGTASSRYRERRTGKRGK